MIPLWNILIILLIIELIMATTFAVLIAGIARKPVGARLLAIAGIFTIQSIVSLAAFSWWKSHDYGPEISGPLLAYHMLTIGGLAILIDIARR